MVSITMPINEGLDGSVQMRANSSKPSLFAYTKRDADGTCSDLDHPRQQAHSICLSMRVCTCKCMRD